MLPAKPGAPPKRQVTLVAKFYLHSKCREAGLAATGLFIAAIAQSINDGRDGFVPSYLLRDLGSLHDLGLSEGVIPGLYAPATHEALAQRLVDVGLFEVTDGGFRIHDFADYYVTEAQMEARRSKWRRRQQLTRDKELRQRVRERDNDQCRYCKRTVNWADRRGPGGGTYDHIDPDGPNNIENLVVACRSCNGRKSDRSLAECGMVLYPPSVSRSDLDTTQIHAEEEGSLTRASVGSALQTSSISVSGSSAPGGNGADDVDKLKETDYGSWAEPFRRISVDLRGADSRTPLVLASVMKGMPESVMAQAVERLRIRRGKKHLGPIRNEAKWLVVTLKELGDEHRSGRAA